MSGGYAKGWNQVIEPDGPSVRAMEPNARQEKRQQVADDDFRVVQAGLRGEPHDLSVLVERLKCVPRILAALNNRLGGQLTEHDLADLSQDSLLVIWRKLERFEGRAKLETWVYRICYLEILNRVRSNTRSARHVAAGSHQIAAAATANPGSSIDYEDLERGLAELEAPEADVIRLKHFEEQTFRDIGRILQIPVNSAKTIYYRGIDRLSRRLRGPEGSRP